MLVKRKKHVRMKDLIKTFITKEDIIIDYPVQQYLQNH